MVTQRGPRYFHVTIVNISHLREDKTLMSSIRGPQFSLGGSPTWKPRVVSPAFCGFDVVVDAPLTLIDKLPLSIPPSSYFVCWRETCETRAKAI